MSHLCHIKSKRNWLTEVCFICYAGIWCRTKIGVPSSFFLFCTPDSFFPVDNFFSPQKVSFTAAKIYVFVDNSHAWFKPLRNIKSYFIFSPPPPPPPPPFIFSFLYSATAIIENVQPFFFFLSLCTYMPVSVSTPTSSKNNNSISTSILVEELAKAVTLLSVLLYKAWHHLVSTITTAQHSHLPVSFR